MFALESSDSVCFGQGVSIRTMTPAAKVTALSLQSRMEIPRMEIPI